MSNEWSSILVRGTNGTWCASYYLCAYKTDKSKPPKPPDLDPTKFYACVIGTYTSDVKSYNSDTHVVVISNTTKGTFRYPSSGTGKVFDYFYQVTQLLEDTTQGTETVTLDESATCCTGNTSKTEWVETTLVAGTKSTIESLAYPLIGTTVLNSSVGDSKDPNSFTETLITTRYILDLLEIQPLGNNVTPPYRPDTKLVKWGCNTYDLNDSNPNSYWRLNGATSVKNQFGLARSLPICPPPESVDTSPYICDFIPVYNPVDCPDGTIECLDLNGNKCCINCCEIGAYIANQLQSMWR